MRLGVIADIHGGPDVIGPDFGIRLGSKVPTLLHAFVRSMRQFRPDCVVDLGDRINSVVAETDRVHTAEVRSRLVEAGVPVYHVFGNHDVEHLTSGELTSALAKRGSYEYIDCGGLRLILLNSLDPPFERVGGTVGAEQLAWLDATLRASATPCLVFCHHALDEQEMTGHFYFTRHPTHAHARNREQARRLLEESDRVLAVFMGHMHWTRLTTIHRIPYLTLASLTEGAFTDGVPCGAYAEVTVEGRTVDIRIAGLLPEAFHIGR